MPDIETVERAAQALLREHPEAQVCALSSSGLIVPVPGSVPLFGQTAIEGRAVTDVVVAADRVKVVTLWQRLQHERAVQDTVHLLGNPSQPMMLHFLDMRETHDIRLAIVLPAEGSGVQDEGAQAACDTPARPRYCTLIEDEGARVLECDAAFTEMFGYTNEELLGESVLDHIHPDDQGRAVEGWIAMLSSHRGQQTRLRRRRKDGSFTWVDTTLHNFLHDPQRKHVLVEIIDVSEEMAVHEALQEREELLRRLTEAIPLGLLQLDVERQVVYHNARLLELLLGSTPPAGAGAEIGEARESRTPLAELLAGLSEESRELVVGAFDRVLEDGRDEDLEVDVVRGAGKTRRALLSIRALRRPDGAIAGAISSTLDITDSARARDELERRATFDGLTAVRNRSSVLGALEAQLERDDGAIAGLIYVDLDNFKTINDSLGHAAGDELLCAVARRMSGLARTCDFLGRLGGDEFLMVLPDLSAPKVAREVGDRVAGSVGGMYEIAGTSIRLRLSVGVASARAGTLGADELLRQADAAMYLSKQQGRGGAVAADAATVELAAMAGARPRSDVA